MLRRQLSALMKELGYDSPEADQIRWVKEREDMVAQLRIACRNHGDNQWDAQDYLPDVLEKSLMRVITSKL